MYSLARHTLRNLPAKTALAVLAGLALPSLGLGVTLMMDQSIRGPSRLAVLVHALHAFL